MHLFLGSKPDAAQPSELITSYPQSPQVTLKHFFYDKAYEALLRKYSRNNDQARKRTPNPFSYIPFAQMGSSLSDNGQAV